MTKQFWAVIVAIAIILGGIFALTNHKSNNGNNSSSSSKSTLTNHVEGEGKKGVTLIEYGDYQCPACGEYYQPLKQVFDKYHKDIYFQFRNFPLTQLHQNAFAGARAAEAASMQGKYWQMHDLLYEGQQIWGEASSPINFFNQYATQLGLNINKFKQDYASDQVNNYIRADMSEGNKLGIDSTPTFFLDGKKIESPNPTLQAFSQVLDAEIAQKNPPKSH